MSEGKIRKVELIEQAQLPGHGRLEVVFLTKRESDLVFELVKQMGETIMSDEVLGIIAAALEGSEH